MAFQHHGPEGDHNSTENSRELQKLFDHQADAIERLQAQIDGRARRKWSDGRLSADDDGEIAFAIGPHPDKELVVIDFGKGVEWVAMHPQQAIELAQALIKHARAISKTPLKYSLH